MRYMNILFLLLCLSPGAVRAAAGEAEPVVGVVTVNTAENAPEIDGKIAEGEWTGPVVQGFFQPKADLLDRRGGRFMLTRDDKALYLAVVTPVHPRYGPVARYRRNRTGSDMERIVLDDSIELWLVPGLEKEAGEAFQLLCNTTGSCGHKRFLLPCGVERGWHPKGLRYANDATGDTWVFEAALPLAAVGMKGGGAGLRLRVCRNYHLPFAQARTNPGVKAYTDASTMLRVRFADRSMLVEEPDWLAEGAPMLTLRNPAREAATVKVGDREISLPAGDVKEVSVKTAVSGDEVREARITVTDPAGGVVHRRLVRWRVGAEVPWYEVM